MNLLQSVQIAIVSLVQNRMRALLTTLGIVIGVAAVIALITLGQGVELYVRDQFQSLGANLLIITAQQPDNEDRTRIEPLTNHDLDAVDHRDLNHNRNHRHRTSGLGLQRHLSLRR